MVVGEVAQPVQTLVIGGGPGGYTAAARAAELGQEVVLVEAGELGGVCLHTGCIPSQAIVSAARDAARGLVREFGDIQAWKQGIVDDLTRGVGQVLRQVQVVHGFARFLDAHRVAVESGDQVSHYRFEHAVIATGSRPLPLPELPVDGARVVDSDGALAFPGVPGTLAVVGGGHVGMELGIAFAKLGARVSVVEITDRILPGFDADLVREVERTVKALGIDVRTGTVASKLDDDGLVVSSADVTGHLPAERVLVAIGRRPNTDDLQLGEAGLEPDDTGHLPVDEQRRTAVRHVFAVGDVTTGRYFAHKAMAEGRVAAEAIAGQPVAFDQVVPMIAFTDPELASVGLSEDPGTVVGRARFASSGRAATLGERRGVVKVVADEQTETVLGVHIAGPGATDLAGEAALAVESAATLTDLAETIHPHPTLVEIIGDAARAARRG